MKSKGHFRWECRCGQYIYDGYPAGPISYDELVKFMNEARSLGHRTADECEDELKTNPR